jgi:hypothetical protein
MPCQWYFLVLSRVLTRLALSGSGVREILGAGRTVGNDMRVEIAMSSY